MEPYTYLLQIAGKEIRSQLAAVSISCSNEQLINSVYL